MLELRHLAAFDAVATEGTFGRAAVRLGYTQSTVSQRIAALEQAVGGRLFDRLGGPRAVQLTALGDVLLVHARELLARVSATGEAIERFRAGDGRIHIGTFQSVTNVILPTVLRRLRDEVPTVDIRLFEEETGDPRIDGLDLLFFDGVINGDVEQVKVLDDPYVLVAPRGQFPHDAVPMAALDGVPMIAQLPIGDQANVERVYADAGVAPLIVFRTTDNRGVVSMVRAGMGVAVMPSLAIDLDESDDQLRLHVLEPALRPREIYLAWPARRTLSPLVTRARELVVEVASGTGNARMPRA